MHSHAEFSKKKKKVKNKKINTISHNKYTYYNFISLQHLIIHGVIHHTIHSVPLYEVKCISAFHGYSTGVTDVSGFSGES